MRVENCFVNYDKTITIEAHKKKKKHGIFFPLDYRLLAGGFRLLSVIIEKKNTKSKDECYNTFGFKHP